MKKLLLLSTLFCASLACYVQAQVQVSIKLPHTSFIQFEQVFATVTILNDTEARLVLDSANTNVLSGLRFVIRREIKHEVEKRNQLPMIEYLELNPGEKKEFLFDITRWYLLPDPTRYDLYAQVYFGERIWDSNKIMIDIVNGLEEASITKAVPGYPDRSRRYSLRYLTRDRQEHLFMRAEEEAAGLVYVYPLGIVLRVQKPQIVWDRSGSVIVSHQASRERYVRSEFKVEDHDVRFIDQQYFNSKGEPYAAKRPENPIPAERKELEDK